MQHSAKNLTALKVFKKILKVSLWMLFGVFGFVVLACVAVYLPPVQKFAIGKASAIVEQKTGMRLSVDRFRLGFPLGLSVSGAKVVTATGDTLAEAASVKAAVALWPLFAGKVTVRNIALENARSMYRDTVSGMVVRARLTTFSVGRASLGIKSNSVSLGRAVLEGADVSLDGGRNVSKSPKADTVTGAPWKFDLRRLNMSDVRFAMNIPPSGPATGSVGSTSGSRIEAFLAEGILRTVSLDTASPLAVKADGVELSGDNSFAFITSSSPPRAMAFDPGNIRADSLGLVLNNVSYGAPGDGGGIGDISARLAGLRFSERSGLTVTGGSGDMAMNSEGLSLKDFALSTTNSTIDIAASAGQGILRVEPSTPVSLTLSSEVGINDLLLFVPVAASGRRVLDGRNLTLAANMDGTLNDITLERLSASMPGSVDLNVRGEIRGVTTPDAISGNATFDGTFGRLDFVRNFIPDTALRRRIAFPRRMTLRGSADFSPSLYRIPDLTLTVDTGRLDVKASLAMPDRRYDADVRSDAFPIGEFFPRDSLGTATFAVKARGRGFDPFAGMNTTADVQIDHLDYKGFTYHDMELAATLADGKLDGRLTSSNEALSLDLALDGSIARDSYSAAIKGNVWRADIHRMGFSTSTLAVTTRLDIEAGVTRDGISDTTVPKPTYTLTGSVDSTVVRFGESAARVDDTTIKASASSEGTSATIRSGDLSVDLSSPLALDSLVRGAGSVGSEVRRQLAARHFSADSLQSALPVMTLTMKAGRGNFIRDMARIEGVDFRTVSADISTVAVPFSVDADISGFRTGKLALDTIDVHAHRNGNMLDYSFRFAGNPADDESLGRIEISGSAGGNSASVNVLQRNRADSVGFDFGVNASLQGNTVRVEMTPLNPILGYQRWSVNEGNSVEYDTDEKFRGNLRLTGPSANEYVTLESASLPDILDAALRLGMAGIGIAPVLDLLPNTPPIDGEVSSDLTFGFRRGPTSGKLIIVAKGDIGVGDFTYNGKRVADVASNVDFQSDATGRMILDGAVSLDGREALTAKGYYTSRMMDFTVDIPGVPLSMAEAFLPDDTATLTGNLDGKLHVTGTPSGPSVTGDFGFIGARADVLMIGTAFGISPDRITIDGSRLSFNGFGITAPNKQKLSIDGTMDVSDFLNPVADVKVNANNFQLVRSDHIGGSQIYGNAAFDMDVTARGPLSSMTVRGNVALAETTDVVYILRNQSKIRDEKQDIVTFQVFADSLYTDTVDTTAVFRRTGIDMLVGVGVGEGLKATLSLDELNENRVELEGGGNLVFSMNTQGDMRLSGRYTLSGGTVYYKPPVISQKIFDVSDGSYVEWTGEAVKPEFHVTATQTMSVDLAYDDGAAEQVEFDIEIDISGSLSAMDIRFDVSAPSNLAIQNQLMAMSEEARMQQALTLLVYQQYTGPGVSSQKKSGIDARGTLNDFISKEVNQWARNNLKGVDLSMGIDTRSDQFGSSHTDYSYSVSKSLFSDRVKVAIGGSVADNANSQNFADNLVDDITLEYRLTDRDNMFLKLYRYNTRASILEGQVTETGGGFVLRKKMIKFGDLFRSSKKRAKRNKVQDEK